MAGLWPIVKNVLAQRRGSITAAAAGFTAFVNIYALQSLLPLLAEAFQTTDRTVSLAVSATTLAVALASPLAGWLVGRMTRGALTKLSVGGLVFCGLQVSFSADLESLLFWRFVQGLFLPILISGVLSFLSQDFPSAQVSRATSHYVTWTIVGGFAGRWLGGLTATAWGWRPALFSLALVNALAGCVLIMSLKDPTARMRSRKTPTLRDFLHSFRRPELRTSYTIGFTSLFTMIGVFTYVTFYLAQAPFNLSPSGLGKIFCVYLLGIAITPVVGNALACWGIPLTVRRSAYLALAGLLLTLLPNLAYVVTGLSFVCVAGFAAQASVSSLIAHLPEDIKAVASGLYLSSYYLGGCLGAAVPGLLWERSGWWGCVALLLSAQIVTLSLSRQLTRTR